MAGVASYLRERIAQGSTDAKTVAIYQGVLEVLDPTRRDVRLQREMAEAAKAVAIQAARDRRGLRERRMSADRRKVDLGSPTGVERRSGVDRRSGRDRRSR